MLPIPSSSRRKVHHRYGAGGSYAPLPLSASHTLNVLRTRTRLTNLAVSLLVVTLVLSLVTNIRYWAASVGVSPGTGAVIGGGAFAQVARSRWQEWDELATPEQLGSGRPPSLETTIHRDRGMGDVDHLIMVPGHAVWTGVDPSMATEDDDWVLEDMQRGGSVKTYVAHIEEAAVLLRQDPHSLLVFSGGATRSHTVSPLTEAVSYHRLAVARGLLPRNEESSALPAADRATTEEFALDSYENLLFSIARFREVTGRWPAKITVVGYGMKQRRFEQLHRGAIRFPADAFTYVGIDDSRDTTAHYTGELKYGYAPFLFSPSGCRPPLSNKRAKRNPYARYPPYHASTPELVPLLEWCPPEVPIGSVEVPSTLRHEDGTIDNAGKEPPAGFVTYSGPLPWSQPEAAHIGRERD